MLGALDVGPGKKVAWCGQNSTGIVEVINACRKLGATAVPVNYRLSDDETAYVVDHCDATIVYVDAEFAATFQRVREAIPKVEAILVFDGPPLAGMESADDLIAASPTDVWVAPGSGRRDRRRRRR